MFGPTKPHGDGSRYPIFDRSQLTVLPLAERRNLLRIPDCLQPLGSPSPLADHPTVQIIADRISAAKQNKRARVAAMGAHVLRAGVGPHLIDLIEHGDLTLLAFNGAGAIHDFEFALQGQTTESVPDYIRNGQFGLWKETGKLNQIAKTAASEGLGLGEAIGREIETGDYAFKAHSVFAAAYRAGVPATVHVGIGYDIVFELPDCDGAAWGAASYQDFLIFTKEIQNLEGGVFLCLGSAVMGPEVYLKALSMARNVARGHGESITKFTTLVGDLISIQGDPAKEAPKSDPQYYYRPYKTILVRTVADGGESYYLSADHRDLVPAIRNLLAGLRTP